jgi:transketolase
MAAICNGLAAYGALRPFCSTFLNFIEYCLPAVRLSALSHHAVLYVMTHDSVGLGEDGPTHQPIEAIPALRAMPGVSVWRPADGNETNAAYVAWTRSHGRPAVVCLSRQAVPPLAASSIEHALRGAYVVQAEAAAPAVVLVATGSEVGLALEAAKLLGAGARVVSMPCVDVFAAQDAAYREAVLPAGVPVLAVEAAATFGWHSLAHAAVGIDRFGASAPGSEVFRDVGLTKENVAATAQRLMARFPAGTAPPLGNV